MKGININCKNRNYVDEILRGEKTVETRDSKSLHSYVGKRVGLIETGKGRALLKGYATITAVYGYETEKEFDNHSYLHRIYPGDEYYINNRKKYGYVLEDVEACEPRFIYSKGIVAREI